MGAFFTARDTGGRRRIQRRHLVWLLPLGIAIATAMFFGVGNLVAWLWRVTLVDIFAIKPISFWQAWGLVLLSQILFKANMHPTARTGHRRARVFGRDDASQAAPPPAAT